jgi:hypothetical protein
MHSQPEAWPRSIVFKSLRGGVLSLTNTKVAPRLDAVDEGCESCSVHTTQEGEIAIENGSTARTSSFAFRRREQDITQQCSLCYARWKGITSIASTVDATDFVCTVDLVFSRRAFGSRAARSHHERIDLLNYISNNISGFSTQS